MVPIDGPHTISYLVLAENHGKNEKCGNFAREIAEKLHRICMKIVRML